MSIKKVKLSQIKPNNDNPRYITDDKFEKLVKSIKNFPEMLEKRPIIVDEKNVVLGGNMRLRACKEAGLKTIPIIVAENWSEEQKQEFIIKDNVGFGQWDWDIIANEWDVDKLEDWGLDVFIPTDVELDNFFEDAEQDDKKAKGKIILEYSEEEAAQVKEELLKVASTVEQAVWQLLGLD